MIYKGEIVGKYVKLRSIEEKDAKFSLDIRQDKKHTRFLHNVDNDINKQIKWIQKQQNRENDYFFIVETTDGKLIGTVGIYDIKNNKGHYGRILSIGDPFQTFEANMLVVEWAYEYLGLDELYGDVQIENKPSKRLCTTLGFKFGKTVYDEELDRYIQIGRANKDDFSIAENKLKRLIYKN